MSIFRSFFFYGPCPSNAELAGSTVAELATFDAGEKAICKA
jgi:hypothetical protein